MLGSEVVGAGEGPVVVGAGLGSEVVYSLGQVACKLYVLALLALPTCVLLSNCVAVAKWPPLQLRSGIKLERIRLKPLGIGVALCNSKGDESGSVNSRVIGLRILFR